MYLANEAPGTHHEEHTDCSPGLLSASSTARGYDVLTFGTNHFCLYLLVNAIRVGG